MQVRPIRALLDFVATIMPDGVAPQWTTGRLAAKFNRAAASRQADQRKAAMSVQQRPTGHAVVQTQTAQVSRHAAGRSAASQTAAAGRKDVSVALREIWEAKPYGKQIPEVPLASAEAGGRILDIFKTADGHRVSVSMVTGNVYAVVGDKARMITRVTDPAVGPNSRMDMETSDRVASLALSQIVAGPTTRLSDLERNASVLHKTSASEARGSRYMYIRNPLVFNDGTVGRIGVNTDTAQIFLQLNKRDAVVGSRIADDYMLQTTRADFDLVTVEIGHTTRFDEMKAGLMAAVGVRDEQTPVQFADVIAALQATSPVLTPARIAQPAHSVQF